MSERDLFKELNRLIKKADLPAIKLLIPASMDPNFRNPGGWSPLMLAAWKGRTSIARYLISVGSDVAAIDSCGCSALAYAALEGECRTIQLLLDAGAPVDVQPHGVSLLKFAAWGGGRMRTQRHFQILRDAGAV
jgi:ankyrin repeat protein